MAIGIASKCKVNANIGASPNASDAAEEEEVEASGEVRRRHGDGSLHRWRQSRWGAHSDYRCFAGADRHRAQYQALESVHGSIEKLDEDDFLHIIEKHCQQGVDYQTIHAGLLIEHLPKVKGASPGL